MSNETCFYESLERSYFLYFQLFFLNFALFLTNLLPSMYPTSRSLHIEMPSMYPTENDILTQLFNK